MLFCQCQPNKRCDNEKASATVNLFNEQLSQVNTDIIENKNISDKHLCRHGFHLTNHEWVQLAKNFISYVKKLQRLSYDSYTKGSVRTQGIRST